MSQACEHEPADEELSYSPKDDGLVTYIKQPLARSPFGSRTHSNRVGELPSPLAVTTSYHSLQEKLRRSRSTSRTASALDFEGDRCSSLKRSSDHVCICSRRSTKPRLKCSRLPSDPFSLTPGFISPLHDIKVVQDILFPRL
jgi:hypothetical protein